MRLQEIINLLPRPTRDECQAEFDRLNAEVKAWRECFPNLYYRSMDDCIERTLNS